MTTLTRACKNVVFKRILNKSDRQIIGIQTFILAVIKNRTMCTFKIILLKSKI